MSTYNRQVKCSHQILLLASIDFSKISTRTTLVPQTWCFHTRLLAQVSRRQLKRTHIILSHICCLDSTRHGYLGNLEVWISRATSTSSELNSCGSELIADAKDTFYAEPMWDCLQSASYSLFDLFTDRCCVIFTCPFILSSFLASLHLILHTNDCSPIDSLAPRFWGRTD